MADWADEIAADVFQPGNTLMGLEAARKRVAAELRQAYLRGERQREAAWAAGHAAATERLSAELERWKTACRTREEKCETCEGDGFMDAVVGIDNDGSERLEAEPCGECGGTGRGGVAFLIAETRAQADAELAALHQAHTELTDACARLRTAHPVASAKTSDGSVDQQAVTGGDLSVASVASTTPNGSARRTAEAPRLQATAAGSLDLQRFRAVNIARCVEDFGHTLDSWSVAEWGNAAAGEMGEACNVAKKILRYRDAVTGNKAGETLDALRRKLAQEIADFVIYADLWAASQGIDLEQAIIETFNKKSNELGSDKRLP